MDKLSFIAIADVHLGWKLFNIPELEKDLRDLFSKACRLAFDRKVKYLVIVGDLFDTNKPTPDLINFVRNEVYDLSDQGVTVLGVAGDHDKVLNAVSWMNVCGIAGVTSEPAFNGTDYSDNQEKVLDFLRRGSDKELVEWLFLHCQVPSLFPYTEEKKRIDFKEFPALELYPNLKGIILGDIHKPYEETLDSGDRSVFMGYCGSLGHIKCDEIGTKKGLLYYDGSKLSRLPFEQSRDIVKVNVKDLLDSKLLQLYCTKYKSYNKKPVFVIEYDRETKPRLEEIRALYEVGSVHTIQKNSKGAEGESCVLIRSELSNTARISSVLNNMGLTKELENLTYELLTTEEPKIVLDGFKSSVLLT